jgi:hypothetical protein
MREHDMITRTHVVAAVAAVAAGSLGLAAPTIGRAAFDARNAHQVDGYHAAQLGLVKYWNDGTIVNNFDTCNWTTLLKRGFVAPAKGTAVVHGLVTGETDGDFSGETDLSTRLVLDGKVISQPSELATDPQGDADRGNSPTLGGRGVAKGRHRVALQAEECSDAGAFFIRYRSMTLQFSPFGSAEKPQDNPTVRANPQRHG